MEHRVTNRLALAALALSALAGCTGAWVKQPDEPTLVGRHSAGIEVYDQRPSSPALRAQVGNGHGHIIEETVAFGPVGISMVGSTRQVKSQSSLQGIAGGSQGSPRSVQSPSQQTLRPRQAHLVGFLAVQPFGL